MAFSKATTIKYVKAVSTYGEAELADALSQIEETDVKILFNLTRTLHVQLKSVPTESVEGKQSRQRRPKAGKQDELTRIIRKITVAVEKYESTAEVDKWDLVFAVGENYGDKTFDQLKEIHEKLIDAGSAVDKLRLLNFVERGRLYNFLKNSDERHGSWKSVCRELNICRRTVDRYVDFYNIITTYPRLIICDLSYETIMVTYKRLIEYLDANDSLSAKLKMPLKRTRLCGDGLFSSRRLPGGAEEKQVDDAVLQLQSDGYAWEPAWQLSDELYESESHDD